MKRISRLWCSLALATAAYLLVRLLVLLSSPMILFDPEELANGTIARELLRGFQMPIGEYLYYPQEGGSLVLALLTAPLFAVFGPGYVPLKVSALLLSLAAFWVWFCLAWRFLGSTTAWIFGVLAVFAPPLVFKSELMAWGHHNHVGLFIAAAFFCLAEWWTSDSPQKRRNWACALGLVCGFGMFFAYIFLPAAVACFCAMLASGRERRGDIGWMAAAAVIGFFPWLAINAVNEFRGIKFVGGQEVEKLPYRQLVFQPSFYGAALLASIELLKDALPVSACFSRMGSVPSYWLSRTYFGLLSAMMLLGAVPYIMRRSGGMVSDSGRSADESKLAASTRPLSGRLVVLCLCYVGIFLVVYGVSPFRVPLGFAEGFHFSDFRYALVLYPVLFLLAAASAARLWQERAQGITPIRIAGVGAFGLIIALGAAGWISNVRIDAIGSSFRYRGYSYETYAARTVHHYLNRPERAVALAGMIDPRFVDEYYRGVRHGLLYDVLNPELFASWEQVEPEEKQSPTVWALGETIGTIVARQGRISVEEAVEIARQSPASFQEVFYLGFGWGVSLQLDRDLERAVEVLLQVPQPYQEEAFHGLGRIIGRNRSYLPNFPAEIPPTVPSDALASVHAGIAEIEAEYRAGWLPSGMMSVIREPY